jgi:hypothetical protein
MTTERPLGGIVFSGSADEDGHFSSNAQRNPHGLPIQPNNAPDCGKTPEIWHFWHPNLLILLMYISEN